MAAAAERWPEWYPGPRGVCRAMLESPRAFTWGANCVTTWCCCDLQRRKALFFFRLGNQEVWVFLTLSAVVCLWKPEFLISSGTVLGGRCYPHEAVESTGFLAARLILNVCCVVACLELKRLSVCIQVTACGTIGVGNKAFCILSFTAATVCRRQLLCVLNSEIALLVLRGQRKKCPVSG